MATEVVKRGSTAVFVEKLAPRDSIAHGPGSRGVSPNAAAAQNFSGIPEETEETTIPNTNVETEEESKEDLNAQPAEEIKVDKVDDDSPVAITNQAEETKEPA